jgi:hypothetical protein
MPRPEKSNGCSPWSLESRRLCRARAPRRFPCRTAAYGSCRCRGRRERTVENAKSAFPTAPTGLCLTKRSDHMSNRSGQITCQQHHIPRTRFRGTMERKCCFTFSRVCFTLLRTAELFDVYSMAKRPDIPPRAGVLCYRRCRTLFRRLDPPPRRAQLPQSASIASAPATPRDRRALRYRLLPIRDRAAGRVSMDCGIRRRRAAAV